MNRIFKAAAVILAVFLLIYFIPYPYRIKADMSAKLLNDDSSYTFSINARRHKYLIRNDTYIPEIKIWKGDEVIFSFADIDYSMYESSIPVKGDENISIVSFSYYDGKSNLLKPATLTFSETKNIYMLETENFTCIAPAEADKTELEALMKTIDIKK